MGYCWVIYQTQCTTHTYVSNTFYAEGWCRNYTVAVCFYVAPFTWLLAGAIPFTWPFYALLVTHGARKKILQKKSYDLCLYPVSMSAFSLAWSLLKEDGQPWENASPYNMHDHHEWEDADPYGYGYGMDGEGTGFYDIFTDALRHELHHETPLESWQVRTPELFELLQIWDKTLSAGKPGDYHNLDYLSRFQP